MKPTKRNKHKQCWLWIKRAYKSIAFECARKNGEPSEVLAENIAQCINAEFNNITSKGTINYIDTLKTFEEYLGLRYTFETDMKSRAIIGELMKLLIDAKKQYEV